MPKTTLGGSSSPLRRSVQGRSRSLIETGQRSVPDVAKSISISTNLLYCWRDLIRAGKQR